VPRHAVFSKPCERQMSNSLLISALGAIFAARVRPESQPAKRNAVVASFATVAAAERCRASLFHAGVDPHSVVLRVPHPGPRIAGCAPWRYGDVAPSVCYLRIAYSHEDWGRVDAVLSTSGAKRY
jgi:hypothetical protein